MNVERRSALVMDRIFSFVIPGRREAANPESTNPAVAIECFIADIYSEDLEFETALPPNAAR